MHYNKSQARNLKKKREEKSSQLPCTGIRLQTPTDEGDGTYNKWMLLHTNCVWEIYELRIHVCCIDYCDEGGGVGRPNEVGIVAKWSTAILKRETNQYLRSWMKHDIYMQNLEWDFMY